MDIAVKARIKKAADLLAEISSISGGKRLLSPATVASSLRAAVGDDIFEHSRVFDIANGSIIVLTSHPGWRQQILLKKEQILARVNADFPELNVRNIVFKE